MERIQSLNGTGSANTSAITGALEYTKSKNFKGTARLEFRTNPSANSMLNTIGLAYKISQDWTILGKNIINLSQGNTLNAGKKIQERMQIGMAYRQTRRNIWNGLVKYEFRNEADNQAGNTNRKAGIISASVNCQPNKAILINASYAGKTVDDTSTGIPCTLTAQLISGRVVYELTPRWDVGVSASKFFSGAGQAETYGTGIEVGYLLYRDLWLSLGCNFSGFSDPELTGEDYTAQGPFLRLRFKFGEDLFGADDRKTVANPGTLQQSAASPAPEAPKP
jgi:large repetitive protein